jgi:hypothetical protein
MGMLHFALLSFTSMRAWSAASNNSEAPAFLSLTELSKIGGAFLSDGVAVSMQCMSGVTTDTSNKKPAPAFS